MRRRRTSWIWRSRCPENQTEETGHEKNFRCRCDHHDDLGTGPCVRAEGEGGLMYNFVRLVCASLVVVLSVSGCSVSVPVSMYPVKGPYADLETKPVIVATAHDVQNNTGAFEVTMPDGEKCHGKWSSAAGVMHTTTTSTLWTKYGPITGLGSSITNVPGVNRGQAMSFCSSGKSLEAEFLTGSGTANGYGVAVDSDGNIYKLLF